MEDPVPYAVNPQLQPLPVTARSRFVQQADVNAAADAILKERTRPTVEKVRARLGRGSPNTIGPLLEKWFAQLADRLEGAPAGRSVGGRAGEEAKARADAGRVAVAPPAGAARAMRGAGGGTGGAGSTASWSAPGGSVLMACFLSSSAAWPTRH